MATKSSRVEIFHTLNLTNEELEFLRDCFQNPLMEPEPISIRIRREALFKVLAESLTLPG